MLSAYSNVRRLLWPICVMLIAIHLIVIAGAAYVHVATFVRPVFPAERLRHWDESVLWVLFGYSLLVVIVCLLGANILGAVLGLVWSEHRTWWTVVVEALLVCSFAYSVMLP